MCSTPYHHIHNHLEEPIIFGEWNISGTIWDTCREFKDEECVESPLRHRVAFQMVLDNYIIGAAQGLPSSIDHYKHLYSTMSIDILGISKTLWEQDRTNIDDCQWIPGERLPLHLHYPVGQHPFLPGVARRGGFDPSLNSPIRSSH